MLKPLRVAVLCSRRCPGVADLLSGGGPGGRWNVVAALTTEESLPEQPLFESARVPVVSSPIRAFYRRRGRPISDLSVREEYDEDVARLLSCFHPDLLLFSSYLYFATCALLASRGGRVINIHGSDLYRRGPDGRPLYVGLRAVRNAILAGEPETRATAHWVTEELDAGTPILRSRPFPVSPLVPAALARHDIASVKAYAFAHQEWMLNEAWGPMWRAVLRFVISGQTVSRGSEPAARPPARNERAVCSQDPALAGVGR